MVAVFPGTAETLARDFRFKILLIAEDFPTLDRPEIILLTKADKLNKTQTQQRLQQIVTELPCGEEITMVPIETTSVPIPSSFAIRYICLQQNALEA